MSAAQPRETVEYLRVVEQALGAAAIRQAPESIAAFVQDARGGQGSAAAVILPRTTQEVSLAMREAVSRGIRLVPQGANTGLVGAGVPSDGSATVILSLARLGGDPQIDAANRSATVAAGVPLSKLNQHAQQADLCFPIDVAADPHVGGMIAANTGGSRFVRYGDVRRNVLGIEVVLADRSGTVLDLMSPLWKNNAALDLKQLFIGSSGSLGVITRAVLALQPQPRSTVTALLVPGTDAAVIDALCALEQRAGAALSAFEGMSQRALAAAIDHVPSARNPFARASLPDFVVLAELSSTVPNAEESLIGLLDESLAPLIRGDRPAIDDVLLGQPGELWALRHAVPEGVRKSGKVVACDIAVPRGRWAELRRALRRRLRDDWPHAVVCDFGHVGDGGLHFNVVWPDAVPGASMEALEEIRAAVFAIVVEKFAGTFSAEHGIGPRNRRYYRQFTAASVLALSGAIQDVINPGRLGLAQFGPQDEPARSLS